MSTQIFMPRVRRTLLVITLFENELSRNFRKLVCGETRRIRCAFEYGIPQRIDGLCEFRASKKRLWAGNILTRFCCVGVYAPGFALINGVPAQKKLAIALVLPVNEELWLFRCAAQTRTEDSYMCFPKKKEMVEVITFCGTEEHISARHFLRWSPLPNKNGGSQIV